jgi:hypothetical protein
MTDNAIEHQADRQRFIIIVDNQQALLEYRLQDNQIDFSRTYVADALRGQGLAERLVRHGLQWAQEQQYEITASCSYVQKFL